MNDSDIRVRIAGDLADIRRSMDELRRQTRGSGTDAKAAGRDWSAFNRQLTGIRNSIRSIVGAYLSFRAVSSLVRGIVRNTAEQERVQAQVRAAIESTGGAAKITAEELFEMAAGLQQVTTFGDEEILNAQSQLLTFTNITRESFEAATEAALNLSTRMGTDLRSAVVQIGKALNDPIRGVTALAEAGIQFTDQQRAMIRSLVESGDLLGAQRMILAELETQFGGAARAARDTFGGALKAVQNAAGKLLEAEGGGLADLTTELNNLAELLSDPEIREGLQVLTGIFAKLAGDAVAAAAGLGNFASDLRFIGRDMIGQVDELERMERQLSLINRRLRELDRGGFSIPGIDLTREQLEAARDDLQTRIENWSLNGRILRRGRTPAAAAPTSAPPPGETAEERAAREAREAAARAAAEAADQAEAELQARLEGIHRRLLVAQGQTVEARRAALEAEFADLLAELDAKGDEAGAALVRKLINVELAKTRLEELRAEFDRVTAEMGRQEQSIQAMVETGAISESEGRRRINELYAATRIEVERLLPLMEELATTTADPAMLERVAELKTRMLDLGETAISVGDSVGNALRDAGEQAFGQWLADLDNLGDAFRGFLEDLKRQLARLVASRLIGALFGGGGGGGFSFHGGGVVGRGGSRRVVHPVEFAGAPRLHRGGLASDEVPAILQRGEEVLTRSDPRHVLNAGLAGGNRTEINVSGTSDPALVITAAVQAASIIERRQARRRR